MPLTEMRQKRRSWGIGIIIAALLIWFIVSFRTEIGDTWYWLRDILKMGVPSGLSENATLHSRQILIHNLVIGFLPVFIIGFIAAAAQTLLPVQNIRDAYRAAWHLLFNIFGLIGPAIFIKEGKEFSTAEEKRRKGPGVLVVDFKSAVVLEQQITPPGLGHLFGKLFQAVMIMLGVIDRFEPIHRERSFLRRSLIALGLAGPFKSTRVRGAGVVFTRPRERIRGVTSLRKQNRFRNNITGYTRDGIKLSTGIWCLFTVGQLPDTCQVTYEGSRRYNHMRLISTSEHLEDVNGRKTKKIRVHYLGDDDLDPADRVEIHEAAQRAEWGRYESLPTIDPIQVFGAARAAAKHTAQLERVAQGNARAAERASGVMTTLARLAAILLAMLGAIRAAVALSASILVERAAAAGRRAAAAEREAAGIAPQAEQSAARLDVVATHIRNDESTLFEQLAAWNVQNIIGFTNYIADRLIFSTAALAITTLILGITLAITALPVGVISAMASFNGSSTASVLAIISGVIIVVSLIWISLTLAATVLSEAIERQNQNIETDLDEKSHTGIARRCAIYQIADGFADTVQNAVKRKTKEEADTEADHSADDLAAAVRDAVKWAMTERNEAKGRAETALRRVRQAMNAAYDSPRRIPARASTTQILAARRATRLSQNARRLGLTVQVLFSTLYGMYEHLMIWGGTTLTRVNIALLNISSRFANYVATWRLSVILAFDVSARRAAAVLQAGAIIERSIAAERQAAATRHNARQRNNQTEYALVALAQLARRIVDERASAAQRAAAWLATDLLEGDHRATSLRNKAREATQARVQTSQVIRGLPAAERTFAERVFRATASTARDNKNEETPWTDLPVQVSVDLFREMLAQVNYDNLYRPNDNGEFPLAQFTNRFNTVVRNMGVLSYRLLMRRDGGVLEDGKSYSPSELHCTSIRLLTNTKGKVLRERGIKVIASSFLDLIPPKDVYEQRLDTWRAEWEKDTEIAHAAGELAAARIHARARAQAQQAMVYSLSHIFKTTKGSREALALRVLQALETAAADPKTNQLVPKDTIELLRHVHIWLLPGDVNPEIRRRTELNIDEEKKKPPVV